MPVDSAVVVATLAGRDRAQTIRMGDDPIRFYTTPVYRAGQVAGVVQLGLSLDEVAETLGAFLTILGVTLPATLILASLGGVFLAGRALRPVDHIARTAQSIGASDLSQRLNLDLPDDELGGWRAPLMR